jgi:hypothetical protein
MRQALCLYHPCLSHRVAKNGLCLYHEWYGKKKVTVLVFPSLLSTLVRLVFQKPTKGQGWWGVGHRKQCLPMPNQQEYQTTWKSKVKPNV